MRGLLVIVMILVTVEISRARVAFWGRATGLADDLVWWCNAGYGDAVRSSL